MEEIQSGDSKQHKTKLDSKESIAFIKKFFENYAAEIELIIDEKSIIVRPKEQ